MRPNEPVLEVTGLSTAFHTRAGVAKAVDDVSFALGRGEILGLVGESGSGKTVTGFSLLGLVEPPGRITEGSIRLEGEELVGLAPGAMRRIRGARIAMVFQDPMMTLNPVLTIGRQMMLALRAHGPVGARAARDRAVEALAKVGLPAPEARLASYPHELSGGMRQRVSIAMALANDPEVIIADEPTTALDVTVQAQILALLDELRRERGLAIIFITHDFGVVAQLCDRVAVMYAGRIVEQGRTDDILQTPAHPYTVKLMECVPELGAGQRRLAAIPGLPPVVDRLPAGCAFAERCHKARADCRDGEIALVRVGVDRAARCRYPDRDTREAAE